MVPQAVTEKGGETRRRILDTARDEFFEHGYAGTSLNDLLSAAGVTKGGFYFHFDSKQELAVKVVESTIQDMRARVLELAGTHERASDQIVAIVCALEQLKADGAAPAGLDRLCVELRADPAVDLHRPYEAWVVAVTDLLTAARDQGDLDAGADPGECARFAVGAYVGLESLAARTPDPLAIPVESYLRLMASAIGLRSSLLPT